MFLGTYHHTLDTKSRLSLPAKLRDAVPLSEYDSFVITVGFDGCLGLYTGTAWKVVVSRQREMLANPESRHYARRFFSSASPIQIDRNGRFLLPQFLRDAARIDRDITILGVWDHIEIWDAEHHSAYLSAQSEGFEELAERAFNLRTSGQGPPTDPASAS